MQQHEKQNLKQPLIRGMKITFFTIDEFMAMTHKKEVEIVDFEGERYIFKMKGARKKFYLKITQDMIIFEGWSVPFGTDMDHLSSWAGNACFNFAGASAEIIKDYLENKSITQLTPSMFAKCILAKKKEGAKPGETEEILLYPDIETSHAVIQRIKAITR